MVALGIPLDHGDVLSGIAGEDLVELFLDLQDLLGLYLDIGRLPWLPPEGWWIMISAFGRAMRLPFAPEERRNAPIEAAIPTQIVETSHLMKFIVS